MAILPPLGPFCACHVGLLLRQVDQSGIKRAHQAGWVAILLPLFDEFCL